MATVAMPSKLRPRSLRASTRCEAVTVGGKFKKVSTRYPLYVWGRGDVVMEEASLLRVMLTR